MTPSTGRVGVEKGSMLLEVMIGALIVLLASAGFAMFVGWGTGYIDAAGDDRGSLMLAQGELSRYRARGYWDIAPGGPFVEATVPNHPGYRRVTLIRCINPDNLIEVWEDCLPTMSEPWLIPVKEIVVTVSIPGNPKTRPVRLSAVMAAR